MMRGSCLRLGFEWGGSVGMGERGVVLVIGDRGWQQCYDALAGAVYLALILLVKLLSSM